MFATVGYCLFYFEWLLEKPFCDGENSNEGWIGRLAASRAAHFICFFIQYWYAHGSVVLILRSEKWPFSVAP